MEKENTQRFRILMKIFRLWKTFRDKFAASLDVNLERKVELYIGLLKSATLRDIVYWLQLLFSAGIATLGLVLNSTAVIIGAMLISPLMGPILSAGLALSTGDLILAVRATANLILSTLGGVLFALILVALLPFKDVTSEIAARTEPNTLDLVIALFSGAIGSVATCREVKGVVTSIPGVAIAVALMPPLCVVGFGLGYAVSFADWRGIEIATGGGLLYLTNLVAITFTAMIVFIMLRIDTAKVREKVQLWRETDREHVFWRSIFSKIPQLEQAREIRSFSLRLLMILLPLLLIFIPLSQSFSKLRAEIKERQNEVRIHRAAMNIWQEKFEKQNDAGPPRSDLDDLKVDENKGKIQIYLRIFNDNPYSQAEKEKYVALVAQKLDKKEDDIELQLVEIPTSAKRESNPVIQTTPTPLTVAQTQAQYLEKIRSSFSGFSLPSPASLIDYEVVIRSNNSQRLHLTYLSNRDIEQDGKNLLLQDIRRRLNLPNLAISYQRIASETQKIEFDRNSEELSEEASESLENVARVLRDHPNLRLRIMLKPGENNGELLEKRKAKLKEFFMKDRSLQETRFAFSDTQDDDNAETLQFFIRE